MPRTDDARISQRKQVVHLGAHAEAPRAGILAVNLGTPDAPEPKALRRYLKEFLWDPRVVELPRFLWWLVLHAYILPFRSPRSAAAYRKIWEERGSPLMFHTRDLAGAVQRELGLDLPRVRVYMAMRYGSPTIGRALELAAADNVQRLLVLPLYPQYSATTTASVFDALADALSGRRWLPELRFITHYHDEPDWVDAVAARIRKFQAEHGRPDRLLFSFHGIPKEFLLRGDPYYCQCSASARRIAAALDLTDDAWQLSFQSRLGRAEWLKPYTDHILLELARAGIGRVQVVCPGFAVDCLETLEEIAIQNREAYLAAGGKRLDYIPALNAGEDHARVLAGLCRRHGQGWPEFAGLVAAGDQAIRDRVALAASAATELGLD